MTRRVDQHEFVKRWLVDIGAVDIEVTWPRHGHPRIYFTFRGRRMFKPLSSSPSSPHAHQMAIRDIKRMLGITGEKDGAASKAAAS